MLYFYGVEDPHKPSVVSLVKVDKCELCKAFVEATDYDEHAHSHAPKREDTETVKEPAKPVIPKVGK